MKNEPRPGLPGLWQALTQAPNRTAITPLVRAWARCERNGSGPALNQVRLAGQALDIRDAVRLFARADGRFRLGLEEDDVYTLLQSVADAQLRDGAPDGDDAAYTGGVFPGERPPRPSRFFGVTNSMLTLAADADCIGAAKYNAGAGAMLADVRALGARGVRNIGPCNLIFTSMFPDPRDHPVPGCASPSYIRGVFDPSAAPPSSTIPSPNELYEQLVAADYKAFDAFRAVVLLCGFLGITVTPTLFLWGAGGERFDATDPGVAGRPPHEVTALEPCLSGFDRFYWHPRQVGEPEEDEDIRNYQRYGLTVHPGETPVSPYLSEVARRKSLAIAAFGRAVGEFFAHLQDEIRVVAPSFDILRIVPVCELSQELNDSWLNTRDIFGRVADPVELEQLIRDGSIQLATFHVMLASAIHDGFPAMRFRTAPIQGSASPYPTDDWYYARYWLAGLFEEHLEAVTERLRRQKRYWEGGSGSMTTAQVDEAAAWHDTCVASDFWWPSPTSDISTLDATNYVHEVDEHWYRAFDRDVATGNPVDRYQDQVSILESAAAFANIVRAPAMRNGYRVDWIQSEIGFPAAVPPPPDSAKDPNKLPEGVAYFDRTNNAYQAGMLVRLFLTFQAAGATNMGWHAHLATPTDPAGGRASSWTTYTAMALRNNFERPSSSGVAAPFNPAFDAWRRPAWFTFRRLVALTNLAGIAEVLLADGPWMVLRLTFRSPVPGVADPSRSYRYAYIAWSDFKVDAQRPFTFELGPMIGQNAYERLPIVPAVTAPPPPTRAEEQAMTEDRLPTGEAVDWDAVPHREHFVATQTVATVWSLKVTVYASDPDTNPGPLVLLTSAGWRSEVADVPFVQRVEAPRFTGAA